MKLSDLFLNRWLYKSSQDTATPDSSIASATSGPTPTSFLSAGGNAAFDVNTNTLTIDGGKIRTGIVESTGYTYVAGTFSNAGTQINLDNGAILSKMFAIDSAGNAYFKGDISGSSGTFTGTISANQVTAGTLTGSTVQTSASVPRVVMSSGTNDFSVYDSSGIKRMNLGGTSLQFYDTAGVLSAIFTGLVGGSMSLAPAGGDLQTFGDFVISGGDILPTVDNAQNIGFSPGYRFANGNFGGTLYSVNWLSQISGTGGWQSDIVPDYANNRDIGNASKSWNKGWFSNITLGGVNRSTWPSGGGDAYLANNQTFTGSNTFDNSGTGNFFNWIRPTGSNPDIGTSGTKFRNVFCANLGSAGAKVNVYSSGLLACPLPITQSALEKISKTVHKKLEKGVGHYGDEVDYLDIPDAPPEMKKMMPQDEEDGGGEKEDIDLIKTVAFLYSCVKELNEEVKLLKAKV